MYWFLNLENVHVNTLEPESIAKKGGACIGREKAYKSSYCQTGLGWS